MDDIRHVFAYTTPDMGEMKRACASIICAVRLARGDINHPGPRVVCAVADSVTLAKMILEKAVGR